MKVLVCIPHYGSGQLEYLKKVLKEYDSMLFDIDIFIFLTEDFDETEFKNINIKKIFHSPDIRMMLVHQYKKIMAENIENYDLFVYSENDILVRGASLVAFLGLSQKLAGTRFIPGFARYELKDENYKYLIDYHPANATARYGPFWMRALWLKNFFFKNKVVYKKYIIDREVYFEPNNLHSGFFALTREQFEKILSSGNFFKGSEGGFCGTLESAASDIYFRCGMKKIISCDQVNLFLIHHLPNKYVTELAEKYRYNKKTVPNPDRLIKIAKK